MHGVVARLVLCGLLVSHCGCSAQRKFEAAKPTKFLDLPGVDRSSKLENLPFQHSWVAPGMDGKKYSKIVVEQATTDYVALDDWERSSSFAIDNRNSYRWEVNELAAYFTRKIREELRSSSDNRFQLVQTAGPETLIMELALTEVIFGNPVAASASLAAPIPGTGAMLAAIADPSVAYELRLRDGVTGQVVATAADRASTTKRLVNLNKLSATSACREIMENSSELIVEALNKGRFAKVNKRFFEIKPW